MLTWAWTFFLGLVLAAPGDASASSSLFRIAGLVVAGLFVLFGVLFGLVFLRLVRVLAQLVAVTQIGDDPARQPRGGLIGQNSFTRSRSEPACSSTKGRHRRDMLRRGAGRYSVLAICRKI